MTRIRAQLKRVATTPASLLLPSVIPLRAGSSLIVGRAQDADVHLDSTIVPSMISRRHAKLSSDVETGRVTLFDLNSTNGCYVNDQKIEVATLKHGDKVRFGGRGRSIRVGAIDPQPDSEFIYEYQETDADTDSADGDGDGNGDGDEDTIEALKSVTEHIQLLLTWIGFVVLISSYLFAEEGSEEFSYVATYVAPIFAQIGIPFTRLTFTLLTVAAMIILLAAALFMYKSTKRKGGKKKTKEQ